ncbi:MAG: hypothetical protein JOZ25_09355 [Actinobacteria bacterium]|nr:hypothetical protein [Actinomycetota bacterium]
MAISDGYWAGDGEIDVTYYRPPTKAILTGLAETNTVFIPAGSSTPLTGHTASKRHKHGTVFSFGLDQPATVTIAIRTTAPGRRVGSACKPSSHKLRQFPRCKRTVTVASLTRTAHAGRNKVKFTGRIGGKALKPGNYQAIFTAVDAAGASPPQSLSFKIVKK